MPIVDKLFQGLLSTSLSYMTRYLTKHIDSLSGNPLPYVVLPIRDVSFQLVEIISIVDVSLAVTTEVGLLRLVPFRRWSFRSSREADALRLRDGKGREESFEDDGDLDASE